MSDISTPNRFLSFFTRLNPWFLFAGFAAVVLVGGAAFCVGVLPQGDRIALGVRAMNVDLGDLPRVEAESRLRAAAQAVNDTRLTLRVGPHTEEDTLAQIGVTADAEPAMAEAYSIGRRGSFVERLREAVAARRTGLSVKSSVRFEEETARLQLTKLAKELDHPATDATAKWDDGAKKLVVTPERIGAKVDVIGSLKIIACSVADALNNGQALPATLDLPYLPNRPRMVASQFEGVDTVRGAFRTTYASSKANRASNVETAARAISGTILLPGDEFSFNKVVGPRTSSAGFREAPVIMDGQLQPGMGGGVCQVSTTLYNAALLANLEITKRSHHSFPVHYVSPGRDATVSYPSLDLRFRNNTGKAILVRMSAGRGAISASIIGSGPAPKVSIVTGGQRSFPGKTIRKNDPTLPKGVEKVEQKGTGGLAVTATRIVDGKRETLSNDRYIGEARVIRVGTGPAAVQPPATPPATAPSPTSTPSASVSGRRARG